MSDIRIKCLRSDLLKDFLTCTQFIFLSQSDILVGFNCALDYNKTQHTQIEFN